MKRPPLRLCLVDMNDGHPNQAMRCLHGIVDRYFERVHRSNPAVECQLVHVSPRDKEEVPPTDCDVYISSGGPGSPFDGDGQPWVTNYGHFVDGILDSWHTGSRRRALFAICYSFEMVVRHLGVAQVVKREQRKFGVMPVYPTADGQRHPLLAPFGDRLFAFEHRWWEAVDVDEKRMAELHGTLLARESRDGVSKGRAIMGFDTGPSIEAVQFHPEADRLGVVSWVTRPEQAAAFKDTYGESTYQAMMRTLDDPRRLARTFAFLIPSFLARRFNALAPERDYVPIALPDDTDIQGFDDAMPAAETG
ncbi:MAG: hypothetical protein HY908_22705 [Myxococcales bacterium]|nr:hypothetical protein [Myxococcales bacterium]